MALRNLKGIKQLRFILCQKCPNSTALRNYIANNYENIRQSPANITVRQCQTALPTAVAVYSYGIQQKANLKTLSEKQIEEAIKQMEQQSQTLVNSIKI